MIEYSTEVAQALKNKTPILALESTVITHGLPYPQNAEIAQELETIVRDHNVTPATIAIVEGKIKIGLMPADLTQLTTDPQVVKASTRDLPYVISKKLSAGTTVAATLFCADQAGIKIFATGGIGGFHRGDENDVSADLIELARIPIAVVCAGAKAILDLPRTLQYLETFGIPVIGYRTDTFPAFYSATSDYALTTRVENIADIVKLLKAHWQLSLPSSILIANPIPNEDEIPAQTIEPAITKALKLAQKKGMSGKALTPFLLKTLVDVTKGKSLKANIALIKNNVTLGAIIAQSLSTI